MEFQFHFTKKKNCDGEDFKFEYTFVMWDCISTVGKKFWKIQDHTQMYNFFREKSIYYLPAISSSKLSRRSFCFIFSTSSGVILSLEVKTLTANLIFCQVVSVARALFNVIWIGRSPRWTTHPGISLASLNALLFSKGKKQNISIQGNTRSSILAVVVLKLLFYEIFTSTNILMN